MTMVLEEVAPFGRSLDEYRKMFRLTNADLDGKIISIADGPASFNAELSAENKNVISVDPIYQFSAAQIEKQFYKVIDSIIDQVTESLEDWVWTYHKSPEHLRSRRIQVTESFIEHYEKYRNSSKYQYGELPKLAFENDQFDLALCSHFLFLYSDLFSYQFHLDSLLELLRIAEQVRVFPLLTLKGTKSPYLGKVIVDLESHGFHAELTSSDYEFQKGGNQTLVLSKI